MSICYISVDDVYSHVIKASTSAWKIIRQTCRARPSGYQWMPKYKSGLWDGYISLVRGKRLPTGLVSIVANVLTDNGIECKFTWEHLRTGNAAVGTNRRMYPASTSIAMLDNVEIRDYQLDAINVLLNKERGVAKMATNAGKTVVFAALIKSLGNSNTVVIVQSKDLLYQTSDRLKSYLGRSVGVIGDSHRSTDDIVVATIQTLDSLLKRGGLDVFKERFQHNNILVIDECHHVANNRTFDVLMKVPGWYRYGMSGTPLDRGLLNDLKLISCTGPLCVDVSNTQLIDAGWSAKPVVYMHELSESKYAGWSLDWQTAYTEMILENDQRNETILDIAQRELAAGKSALIIVTRIAHGRFLAAGLVERGILATFVCGNSSVAERQQALSQLDSDDPRVVVATNIFDEGVDVPALDVVILACGGKSHIKLLQRIGRGLRRKEGRNVMHVHDFIDDGNNYLLDHTEERMAVYEQENFQTEYVSIP